MICYVLAMGKQHLGPHVVVGYGIKIFWSDLFITSSDHLDRFKHVSTRLHAQASYPEESVKDNFFH